MKFSNLAELVKDNMQYTIISNIIWETYEKRLSRKDVFDLLKFNASVNLKRILLMEGVLRPGTVIAIGDCYERFATAQNARKITDNSATTPERVSAFQRTEASL